MASPLSPPATSIPSLDNSFGAMYIGMVTAAGLWGISTAQAYWYGMNYTKDPLRLKLLVLFIWIMDTAHQALISQLIYHYVITNYFNPLALDAIIWTFLIQSLFEIFPAFLVQCFYLFRIWRLSKGRWFLVILPAFFTVAKVALNIAWIILCSKMASVSAANLRYKLISELVNAAAAAADILLAVTMVYLLHTSRTGIRQSDNMITRLMVYTINTGVVTSICSIITLIMAVTLPNTYIYGAFYFCLGRLYLNSMLASLNARNALAGSSPYIEMSVTVARSEDARAKLELPSQIGINQEKTLNNIHSNSKFGEYKAATCSSLEAM